MRAALGLTLALLATRVFAQGDGAETFEDRCSICHVAGGGGQGPNLTGVVGRKAATAPGFAYTPALKNSGLTWTAANLDKFLVNPGALVPGTAMQVRINDAAQRAALVAYLATAH